MKNKFLKICFLCRTFLKNRGGTESYYLRMANALSNKGHDIHIIAQKGTELSYYNDLNKSVTVHSINFNEEPFKGSWRLDELIPFTQIRYSIAVAQKINEIQKTHTFDIIQAPDWSSEGFWLAIHKKPLIIRLHGVPDTSTIYPNKLIKPNIRKRLLWNLNQYTLSHAQSISSVSNDFAQLVKESIHYHGLIRTIYNGIDQTIYKPGNAPREQSVLFVGRLNESKGIQVIADAIPLVLKKFPDTKFVFAGHITKYKNTQKTWKDYLNENIHSNNLIFLGQVTAEKIISCYQKHLISIFPSIYEPGGAAAMESMACGCATIATSVGGFQEAIEDGVDGLLIPENNPRALAQAIIKLLKDDVLRKQISINAVEKISSRFSLKNAIENTIEHYERTLFQQQGTINA